jgi:hypothetical protein
MPAASSNAAKINAGWKNEDICGTTCLQERA